LKPPVDLKERTGSFSQLVDLLEGSVEFQLISNHFLETFDKMCVKQDGVFGGEELSSLAFLNKPA